MLSMIFFVRNSHKSVSGVNKKNSKTKSKSSPKSRMEPSLMEFIKHLYCSALSHYFCDAKRFSILQNQLSSG